MNACVCARTVTCRCTCRRRQAAAAPGHALCACTALPPAPPSVASSVIDRGRFDARAPARIQVRLFQLSGTRWRAHVHPKTDDRTNERARPRVALPLPGRICSAPAPAQKICNSEWRSVRAHPRTFAGTHANLDIFISKRELSRADGSSSALLRCACVCYSRNNLSEVLCARVK